MSAAVDISGDGGILYDCKIGGNGTKPQEGMIVFAHYTGKLQNGQVFDSSKDKPHRRDGFYFQLGAGQVIKGWDLGFSSMCIGEVGELTLRVSEFARSYFALIERMSSYPPNIITSLSLFDNTTPPQTGTNTKTIILPPSLTMHTGNMDPPPLFLLALR